MADREHSTGKDAGCPKCGGDNLAAMGTQVWCNSCDWIDPPYERVTAPAEQRGEPS